MSCFSTEMLLTLFDFDFQTIQHELYSVQKQHFFPTHSHVYFMYICRIKSNIN